MRVSDRDLEALSASLDGELSGKEQERLEATIQTDEELRRIFLPRQYAPQNTVMYIMNQKYLMLMRDYTYLALWH